MANKLRYASGAVRPDAKLWIHDDDGALIDFGAGYTFVFRIGSKGVAAVLEKSTGIVGAAGSGDEPTGVPNVVIEWGPTELALPGGAYAWDLVATTGGEPRVYSGLFQVVEVILPAV